MNPTIINPTINKFGYPNSLIKEYPHWVVLLRPLQVTVGSLVLACKEDAQSFGNISVAASTELQLVVADIEHALQLTFNYQKINYLALMMVDTEVHFHVLPRYDLPVKLNDREFEDTWWPGPPDISSSLPMVAQDIASLQKIIISAWPSAPSS